MENNSNNYMIMQPPATWVYVYATKNNGSYSCVRAHASSINLLAFT